jgi:hypothetical protein
MSTLRSLARHDDSSLCSKYQRACTALDMRPRKQRNMSSHFMPNLFLYASKRRSSDFDHRRRVRRRRCISPLSGRLWPPVTSGLLSLAFSSLSSSFSSPSLFGWTVSWSKTLLCGLRVLRFPSSLRRVELGLGCRYGASWSSYRYPTNNHESDATWIMGMTCPASTRKLV